MVEATALPRLGAGVSIEVRDELVVGHGDDNASNTLSEQVQRMNLPAAQLSRT